LTGSVRACANRLRITIHLIDNATASYLWSESIDAEAEDTLAAQETVASAVVRKLEPRLLDRTARHAPPGGNLAARNCPAGPLSPQSTPDEGLHRASTSSKATSKTSSRWLTAGWRRPAS
jgi:hypothetical protein